MAIKPPDGSTITITITSSGREQVISIPYSKPPTARRFMKTMIVCWLGAWAVSEIAAIYLLSTGPFAAAAAFVVLWLCVSTYSGGIAMLTLRRLLQRSVPETLKLAAGGLVYDPGVPLFQMPPPRRFAKWSSLLPKRPQLSIDRTQLRSLQLRGGNARNRLTVDTSAKTVELALAATNAEREWLFKLISDRYSPTVPL